MNREPGFVISHRPYAVDLERLKTEKISYPNSAVTYWGVTVPAVWFRRKRPNYGTGPLRTVACLGTIRDTVSEKPGSALDVMCQLGSLHRRVEGDCLARWDGTSLWSNTDEVARAGYLDVLRPMLEHCPDVPPGYDGWWSYR